MDHENSQTTQQRTYASPQLRLYGSMLALTAAGTGMIQETGMVGGAMNCYDGMTPGMWTTRKHCV
ncbi:MAG: hypothetical protein K8F33_06240 [Thermomonas sp.]|uniref:hypothetical protein n=1 Tax=Thermomonas sp. TaxID=1971895 RepID=UPI001DE9C59D|nr:hypothetical protein [Thermomonas sp.]MBZ0087679.1 hypothetical protein [Thermomonas sp.]